MRITGSARDHPVLANGLRNAIPDFHGAPGFESAPAGPQSTIPGAGWRARIADPGQSVHVALTEILRCGACGEGLVLLTTIARESRAIEGTLGCAACGARHPVRRGVADLRAGQEPTVASVGVHAEPAAESPGAPEESPEGTALSPRDAALRTAALMGLEEARGVVVLVSPEGRQAEELARLVAGVEVVTVDPESGPGAASPGGPLPRRVSPLLSRGELPIVDRRVAGIALSTRSHVSLCEAVRVVAPGGRVVVTDAGTEAAREVERLGCAVLAHERGVLVAERTGTADPPKLYQLG